MGKEIRLVWKYMLLFDTGVPKYFVLALVVVVLGIITGLYLTRKDFSSFVRNSLFSLLIGYVFFVLCVTILFRESSGDLKYYVYPFWSYDVLNYKIIAQLILNVLLFVPLGFLLGATMKGTKWILPIKIGCLLSVMIEETQLFTTRGVCNIDDVIHNTLGCAIGYGIYKLCNRIWIACSR